MKAEVIFGTVKEGVAGKNSGNVAIFLIKVGRQLCGRAINFLSALCGWCVIEFAPQDLLHLQYVRVRLPNSDYILVAVDMHSCICESY